MIVADTHALIWWVGARGNLSNSAREVLDRGPIGVPIISCMEIALLARRRRIVLPLDARDWIDSVLTHESIRLLPLTPEIAITAGELTDPIRDPSDRLIVATALHHDAPLVTKDGRIRDSGIVQTIW